MISRREFLVRIGGTLAAGTVWPSMAASGVDLNDPATNLEAYVKLRGNLSGELGYDLVRGRIYGLIQGEQARPLFRTLGAQVSRYERKSRLEFVTHSRYVGFLTDWETDRPLTRWTNPYNGKRCDVPVSKYGPGASRVLTDRTVSIDASDKPSDASGIRPWYVVGDVVHMVDQFLPAVPPSWLPDLDVMTYSGSWSQLRNASLTRIPSRLSFTAVERWREWMQMELAGSLLWHVNGVKLDSPDDFPDEAVALLVREEPVFFEKDALP
jgi:hypothetical protein